MVVSVIYINSLATKWLNKKNYIADKKKDDLGPSRHAYSSPLYSLYWGKDIRLFNLKSYLIDKYIRIVKEEDKFNLHKTVNGEKVRTVYALTGFAQQCVVYIYVVAENMR